MDRNLPKKGRRCGNPFVLLQGGWWLCQTARHDAFCRCFSLLKMTIASHTREDLGLLGRCGPDIMFLLTRGPRGELPRGQTHKGIRGQTHGKGPSSMRHVGRGGPTMPFFNIFIYVQVEDFCLENLGCGLPYRLGQALCLNVGLRPVLADYYTSEVLPIGVVASTNVVGKGKKVLLIAGLLLMFIALCDTRKKKKGRFVEWVEKACFDRLNKLFVISTNERHYQTLLTF
ncbi:hypothetical protein AAG906_016788 [Vitis piasezkii]